MTRIQLGDQVYLEEAGTMFGAVRSVGRHGLHIYVENAGDFEVRADAVKAAHDGKVVLIGSRLGPGLRAAIAHAHAAENR